MTRLTAKDIRELPLYAPAEAARYLRLPVSTVRAWSFGQGYRDRRGSPRQFEAVIVPADRKHRRLSFVNLIELLILAAIRRQHSVLLPQVRRAVSYLRKHFPSAHPLADHAFQTDGVDLFVEKFGQILNISREGQLAIKQMIQASLRCLERDDQGIPIKLYLPRDGQRSQVVIDPSRGFGRPVVDGIGIRTELVVERFNAGETIASLARDYRLAPEVIEDVIRTEWPLAA